jgi:Mg-chelatase subunit ChlD
MTIRLLLLLVALAGCSKKTDNVCFDGDDQCGIACNLSHPCASGLYCSQEQLCAKACALADDCGSNERCNDDGRCVDSGRAAVSQSQAGSGSIGGAGGAKAPVGGQSGTGTASGFVIDAGPKRDAPSGSDDCQEADVSASRVIPNVILVIDQSGSMTQGFGDGTRWNVLRDFLLRDDGLIARLQTQVKFGLAMYTAQEYGDNGAQPPPCPMVTSVAPGLMNLANISTAYNAAAPLGETPTGDSIDRIVDDLPPAQLDQNEGPTVLILATDGEPDRCEELNPQNGQAEAVAAVTRAYSMGIRTYIISVGTDVSAQHQQDVANAGLGRDASNNAPYWRAGDDSSLRDALEEIIGAQVSCEVALEGSVQGGDPCLGTVELNGEKLECKHSDGWELADPKHIRLLGKACSDYKTLQNAMVRARFPCDVDVVL